MKILITTFDEPDILTLSNEGFENHNFISLIFQHDVSEAIPEGLSGGSIEIPLDDLASAVEAFQKMRQLYYERDKRAE